jgi:hypothetical protein
MPALTHLNATLTNRPTSVDSKQLTACLNPPESTLMKNIGGRGDPVEIGALTNRPRDKGRIVILRASDEDVRRISNSTVSLTQCMDAYRDDRQLSFSSHFFGILLNI